MNLTRAEMEELALLLEEKAARDEANRYKTVFGTLYDWQREFIAATERYSQCCLIAANRIGKCVVGGTMIDTDSGPVDVRAIDPLRHLVRCSAGYARPTKPFSKGEHECFTVTASDGSSFSGADFHRIAATGFWVFLAEVHCFLQSHQKSARDLVLSMLGHGRIAHVSSVQHSKQKAPNYLDDYLQGSHQCDGQPHVSAENDLASFPSQADVLRRTLAWYALGVLASTDKRNLSEQLDRLSSLGEDDQIEGRFFEFLCQAGSKFAGLSSDQCQVVELLSAVGARNPQSIGALLLQCARAVLCSSEAWYFPLSDANSIVSCDAIGRKEVFDFSVPGVGDYYAQGFLHHNTYTGTYIDAIHALGEYPEGWEGHRFDHAPLIWCLGYSGEKTRDLLQTPLVGRKQGDGFTGGLIPADRIVGYESMTGTPNGVRTLLVKHVSGETAKIQFWSYSQGQHALMGDAVDWFHIDEEPQDKEIWPQVLTRTASGDNGRGGRGILTFTPENGRTELVIQFMDTPSRAQFCMRKGWDDAPHLSEKVKEDLLASFPAHQREMRTKGVPMLGHGRIYDIAEEDVICTPFEIPRHFRVINGMDFGWDHPQAQVQLAIDPEAEIIYVTRAWKKRHVLADVAWGAVKSWAANVPTAWPLDGLQTEKGSGKQQKSYYVTAGFKMLGTHATWPDGSNGVEAGLMEIRDLMLKGKFKIFAGLRDLLDELLQYHRDDNGKIVKVVDDALDAMRYAYMMRRFAIPLADVGPPKKVQVEILPIASPFRRG